MELPYQRMEETSGSTLAMPAPAPAPPSSSSSSAPSPSPAAIEPESETEPPSSSERIPRQSIAWLHQWLALCKKNVWLLRHSVWSCLAFLLLPLLLVLLLHVISKNVLQQVEERQNPPVSHAAFSQPVQPCQALDVYGVVSIASVPCISLTYAPSNPVTDDIIARTLAGTELTAATVRGYPSPFALQQAWSAAVGSQDVGVMFDNSTNYGEPLSPYQLHYTLYYNATTQSSLRVMQIQYALEQAMANSIISIVVTAFPPAGLNASSSAAPLGGLPASSLTPRSLSFSYLPQLSLQPSVQKAPPEYNDYVSLYGVGPVLATGITVLAMLVVHTVNQEKQDRILTMLRVNGLMDSAYVSAWLAVYALLSMLAAFVAALTGLTTGMQVFSNVALSVHFMTIWLFMLAMVASALLLAALFSKPRWVNLICFLYLMLCVGFSFGFSLDIGSDFPLLYKVYTQTPVVVGLASLLPVFHLSKMYRDLAIRSSWQQVSNQTAFDALYPNGLDPGSSQPWPSTAIAMPQLQSMSWADVSQPNMQTNAQNLNTYIFCNYNDYACCRYFESWSTYNRYNVHACVSAPSTGTNMGWLVLLTLLYTALAWYVSQVGDAQAGGKRWYFLCTRSHWTGRRKPAAEAVIDGDTQLKERMLSRDQQSIRTVKMTKDFKGSTAVKELTLSMDKDDCFCLLGHNGAGKSTTLNVLTGVYLPTYGEAYVCGYSVREDIGAIQRIIGICSQDNLLWPQLTVLQHVVIMAAIRNLRPELISNIIEQRLRLVNLWQHREKQTSELSGGMKRRLSIAMAMMGDPKCLFLDEPTTGMDAMHRNEVWDAIRAIKRDRVVCLTTHNMEEADALGDKIGLLASGRLRAIGTSLFLKNHYGKGYQLQLLVSPEDVDQLTAAVERFLIGSIIVGKEAGAVTIGLKRSTLRHVPLLFRWLDSSVSREDGLATDRPMLKEWSISNSTLEEVFLRLCAQDSKVNAGIDEFSDDSGEADRRCGVCHLRPPAIVTLYSATGIPIVLPNLMCLPCSFGPLLAEQKAKEEEEERQRLLLAPADSDSKQGDDDDDGERIQWAMDEQQNGGSNGSPAATAASRSTLPSAEAAPAAVSERIEESVGLVPPTLWQQSRAIFLKDAALMRTEKKSWLLRFLVLVLCLAMIPVCIYILLRPANIQQQRPLCPQGFQQPYGVSCDSPFFQSWLFPSFSQSNRELDVQRPAVNGSSSYWRPQWMAGNFYEGVLYPTINIAFADSRGSALGLAGYDVGWGQPGLLNQTSTNVFMTDWTPLLASSGLSLPSQMLANEQLVQSRISNANCGYYSQVAWFINDTNQAQNATRWLFPDYFLTVKRGVLSGDGSSLLELELSAFTPEIQAAVPTIITPATYGGCWNYRPTRNAFTQYHNLLIHGLNNAMLYTAIQRSSSYVQRTTSNGSSPWTNATSPILLGRISPLNRLTFVAADQSVLFGVITLLLVFPSLLLLPWFTERILYEREEELHHMMRIGGMRPAAYVLGNYLFDSTVSWLWCSTLIICGYASGSAIFTETSVFLWILLFAIWIHAQIGVAWFLAAFFKRRRIASIFILLVVVVMAMWGATYQAVLYSLISWPSVLQIFPPLSFIRAVCVLTRYTPTVGAALAIGSDFGSSLNACFWSGTLMLLLGVLAHTLRYQSPEQILALIPAYRDRLKQGRESVQYDQQQQQSGINASLLGSVSGQHDLEMEAKEEEEEEDDVRAERQRVVEKQRADGQAISILQLKKSFHAGGVRDRLLRLLGRGGADSSRTVHAVRGLYLGMDYGDCFGLLGPNGAGKSTTLSILSGLYPPSGGRALIAGHDVEMELDQAYTVLGICPQHDRVYDDLTVEQHLTFYARLKGVARKKERALVQRSAEMVGLDGDNFRKLASTLSGGTRRRLSIANSLIGNPRIWLLDEPTTGLSAEARREVWAIVSKQKAYGRCIVITTHSMEEADTLCSRIGIVCDGQLQAVGTQSHLKHKYGEGFKLTLNLTADTDFIVDPTLPLQQQQQTLLSQPTSLDQSTQPPSVTRRLLRFVQAEVYPSAILASVMERRVQFVLPHTSSSAGASASADLPAVLQVFDRMDVHSVQLSRKYRIQEWGLSHASLEEVFIRIVKQSEARTLAKEGKVAEY